MHLCVHDAVRLVVSEWWEARICSCNRVFAVAQGRLPRGGSLHPSRCLARAPALQLQGFVALGGLVDATHGCIHCNDCSLTPRPLLNAAQVSIMGVRMQGHIQRCSACAGLACAWERRVCPTRHCCRHTAWQIPGLHEDCETGAQYVFTTAESVRSVHTHLSLHSWQHFSCCDSAVGHHAVLTLRWPQGHIG